MNYSTQETLGRTNHHTDKSIFVGKHIDSPPDQEQQQLPPDINMANRPGFENLFQSKPVFDEGE